MTIHNLLKTIGEGIGRAAVTALQEQKEQAYQDRNLLAIAYATEIDRGESWMEGGYYYHDDEEFPVVWAETVIGQQSWHVTPEFEELLADSPLEESEPTNGYDGHSRAEKNQRLVQQVAAGGANRL